MGSTAFPFKEMGRLASFEARLGEDLSLQQIEEIEQQIMVQTTDKTRGVAVGLLNRFDAKKPALIARQITMLDQAEDPVSKIKLLAPLIGYLDPDAVDEKLDKIQFEANLSDDPKVRNAATQQLKHLKFAQAKPFVRDLQDFVDRLGNVVRDVLQTNSLAPMLNGLSAYQVAQVQRGAIGGGS
jgi:hypothetical protein